MTLSTGTPKVDRERRAAWPIPIGEARPRDKSDCLI
jgi:hypothetical protein